MAGKSRAIGFLTRVDAFKGMTAYIRSERSGRTTTPFDPIEAGAWPVRPGLAADDGDGASQDRAHGDDHHGDGAIEETAESGKLSLRHDD